MIIRFGAHLDCYEQVLQEFKETLGDRNIEFDVSFISKTLTHSKDCKTVPRCHTCSEVLVYTAVYCPRCGKRQTHAWVDDYGFVVESIDGNIDPATVVEVPNGGTVTEMYSNHLFGKGKNPKQ